MQDFTQQEFPRLSAIVLAGGETTRTAPLYKTTHGARKAMIEISGKPMIQWVLDALGAARHVSQIHLVGLPCETDLRCNKPLSMTMDQGSMVDNIQAGAEEAIRCDPTATHALLVSCDIPTIQPEMVDWMVEQVQDLEADFYLTLIERATLSKLFPQATRTFVHLKNLEVCAGDLHCFRLAFAGEGKPMWDRLLVSSKNPMRLSSLFNYDALFFLKLRRMSLNEAEAAINQRFGIKGRAILAPYAEIGMDVDRPQQLDLIREYILRENISVANLHES